MKTFSLYPFIMKEHIIWYIFIVSLKFFNALMHMCSLEKVLKGYFTKKNFNSAINYECCGIVMNAHRRLTQKRRNCWIKLFWFLCAHKIFSKLHKIKVEPLMSHGIFNDVLTTFLGLKRVSSIAVYAGSEALRFHHIYCNLCSEDEPNKVLWVWSDIRVSN